MENNACLLSVREAFGECGVSLSAPLLLGVSGGPDSVALLHMLHALGADKLTAAHLNHRIRGGEAERDAAFVRELCGALGVSLVEASEDVPRIARERRLSLEEAARHARYAFLRREAGLLGGAYILTAHHRDDQAETILMNLIRGSALRGLCGMRMLRDGLFRPMLRLSRAQVIAYIKEERLAYRMDSTNMDTDYRRNHVRLTLMPALEAYNPGVKKALAVLSETLGRDEAYLQARALEALERVKIKGENAYLRNALAELPDPIRFRALRTIIENTGANVDKMAIDRLDALLHMSTGRSAPLGGGFVAAAVYDALVIGNKNAVCFDLSAENETKAGFETPLAIPGDTPVPGGRFLTGYVRALRRDEGIYVAYMDADKLPGALTARRRLPGDRFHPLGASGGRKLKQYLIDKKTPAALREAPLIAYGGEVLFFPGGTVSEHMRVTPQTKRILRIEYCFHEIQNTGRFI